MPDVTVWDAIPIHPNNKFFWILHANIIIFRLDRFFLWQKSFQNSSRDKHRYICFFWIAIMIHSIGEIQQMDSFYHIHNISFVLFSYAWSLALCPVVLFWLELRRI